MALNGLLACTQPASTHTENERTHSATDALAIAKVGTAECWLYAMEGWQGEKAGNVATQERVWRVSNKLSGSVKKQIKTKQTKKEEEKEEKRTKMKQDNISQQL